MMADAFLYSFVSFANTTLMKGISYDGILRLFHFSHVLRQFARQEDT